MEKRIGKAKLRETCEGEMKEGSKGTREIRHDKDAAEGRLLI